MQHRFEIQPQPGGLSAGWRIRVAATTRAGLLIAAVQGLCKSAGPQIIEDAAEEKRLFDAKGGDFSALLADVLNKAAAMSAANNETYEEVTFALVTDKEARGGFVGRPVSGWDAPIKNIQFHDLEVAKNSEGLWEVTIPIPGTADAHPPVPGSVV